MKLPSGHEISINSLASAAALLAKESFAQENIDEAEETMIAQLGDEFFSLSGAEKPFYGDDIAAIMNIIRPAAEVIGGELAAVMDKYTPFSGPSPIKEMIGREIVDERA